MNDNPMQAPEQFKPEKGKPRPAFIQRFNRLYWYKREVDLYIRSDVLVSRAKNSSQDP